MFFLEMNSHYTFLIFQIGISKTLDLRYTQVYYLRSQFATSKINAQSLFGGLTCRVPMPFVLVGGMVEVGKFFV